MKTILLLLEPQRINHDYSDQNGRHSSEEPRKFKTNRITQLISKKKNRLAKLAHNKSSSYIRRTIKRKRKKRNY
ncbi:unnamed protein product [Callosobruchus maculatus]|uniref:Uncharacterized protein n=1 Tax=Callosobruchus maculatus TaxID=64391 RepID=A0A653C2Q5_CALMS|nr:unnamed protein product [Callosobruchus maculatus]